MVDFDVMSGHTRSHRAPPGICEITVQIHDPDASEIHVQMAKHIEERVGPEMEVRAYEFEDRAKQSRLVVYTGTDRLAISELRDVAEIYAKIKGYQEGNIPSNMNIIAVASEETDTIPKAWLEFKLSHEVPTEEVREKIREIEANTDIVPKNPIGEDEEAILFREKNYSYSQVKDVVDKATRIRDKLPVEITRLVCEAPTWDEVERRLESGK